MELIDSLSIVILSLMLSKIFETAGDFGMTSFTEATKSTSATDRAKIVRKIRLVRVLRDGMVSGMFVNCDR